jgi:hypothetical protein
MKIKTEFSFVLPGRLASEDEAPQKVRGVMRLIKVKDLIDINRDSRVKESSSYFYVVLLCRVILKLGNEKVVNTKVIENLSTENFAFLVDFMNEINHKVISTFPVKCSGCNTVYSGEVTLVGEL